jgi:hypothetical protein
MRVIYLFIIGVIITSIANAQTIYPSGVPGCIARWTFDSEESGLLNSLPDMSGNGNNGVTTNILSTPGFRNKPLKAGSFDGSTSWAEVAHKSMLNPTEITIVSLVKFNGFYGGTCQGNNIVYKGFDYNSNLSWAMYVAEVDANCTAVNPSIEKLAFNSPSMSTYIPPASNFIDTSKWYFLAVRFNGSKYDFYQIEMDSTIYINNIQPQYTNSVTSPLGSTNHKVYIGVTQNPSFKYWFNGEMDEVVIFNKSLTDFEMQSVYDYLWGFPTYISENQTNLNSELEIINLNNNLTIVNHQNLIKQVEIYDLNGKIHFKSNENYENINVANLGNQLIFVRILLSNKQIITRKVLIN